MYNLYVLRHDGSNGSLVGPTYKEVKGRT